MKQAVILLLVLVAAHTGASPASGACLPLDPVAEAIRNRVSLPLPAMPEATCSRNGAIEQVSKLKDPLKEMVLACLSDSERGVCELLLEYLAQIGDHLNKNNQISAYKTFSDDLMAALPPETPLDRFVERLKEARRVAEPQLAPEDLGALREYIRGTVREEVEKKTKELAEMQPRIGTAPGTAPNSTPILGLLSLIIAIAALVGTFEARLAARLRERAAGLSGFSDASTDSSRAKDPPLRDGERGGQKTNELEDKASDSSVAERGESAASPQTAESSALEPNAKKDLEEPQELGPDVSERVTTLERNLVKREDVHRLINERNEALEALWAAKQSKFLTPLVRAEVGPAIQGYCKTSDFEALARTYWPSPVPATQEKADVSVGFDLDSLRNAWGSFRRRDELEKLAKDFQDTDTEEVRLRDLLERDLGKRLSAVPELKRSYETALSPLESYLFVMRKLKTTLVATVRTAAEELQGEAATSGQRNSLDVLQVRAREGHQLLTLLQATDLTTRLRQFSFRNWLREEFRRFAETFFQTYAQQGSGELEEARQIVLGALAFVGIRPMEIALGRTRFDSLRHVGRGFDRLPDKEDGTIIGIVRYGFEDLDGKVFQPAEVIVNRRS